MTCRTVTLLLLLATITPAFAQGWRLGPEASPRIHDDRSISFRLAANNATDVKLVSPDLPGMFRGAEMTQWAAGIWEIAVAPVEPGAYRYLFSVDGMQVVDPRNPDTSEANSSTWSLIYVPGSEATDMQAVPHGAIAEINYHSDSLDRFRRAHIYTPPGYESGKGEFPVLYLLHGATDSDDSWPTVGRAGYILDNLIAAGKARPMIVVMPNGHTGPFQFGAGSDMRQQAREFTRDFVNDLKPFVESTYRISAKRSHRAIAGLSMGGAQTLDIVIPHLEEFGYFGVYSSGVFGIDQGRSDWVEKNLAALNDDATKQGLQLAWFSIGKEDFLLNTSRATVETLREHGFEVAYQETGGGHSWSNWRNYLSEFSQLIFKN